MLTLSLYSGHKTVVVPRYLALLVTLTATKEVQVTGLFWSIMQFTAMTFRGEKKLITILMGLLCFPVISVIWCMVAIKLDWNCFVGVVFLSWHYDQLNNVQYYHKSCLVHAALFNDMNPVSNQRELSPASNRKMQTTKINHGGEVKNVRFGSIRYVTLHY